MPPIFTIGHLSPTFNSTQLMKCFITSSLELITCMYLVALHMSSFQLMFGGVGAPCRGLSESEWQCTGCLVSSLCVGEQSWRYIWVWHQEMIASFLLLCKLHLRKHNVQDVTDLSKGPHKHLLTYLWIHLFLRLPCLIIRTLLLHHTLYPQTHIQ